MEKQILESVKGLLTEKEQSLMDSLAKSENAVMAKVIEKTQALIEAEAEKANAKADSLTALLEEKVASLQKELEAEMEKVKTNYNEADQAGKAFISKGVKSFFESEGMKEVMAGNIQNAKVVKQGIDARELISEKATIGSTVNGVLSGTTEPILTYPEAWSIFDIVTPFKSRSYSRAGVNYVDFTNGVRTLGEGIAAGKIDMKPNKTSWQAVRVPAEYELTLELLMDDGYAAMTEGERRLRKAVTHAINRNVFYGRGTAESEMDGLITNGTAFNNAVAGPTFGAGDIASVADWDTGYVKLTFTAAHGLRNGMGLTIAASTNYNGTYEIVVEQEESTELLIRSAYVAEATAAWTATTTNVYYQSVDNASRADVLAAGVSLLQLDGRRPTHVFINPTDYANAFGFGNKDLEGRYLFAGMTPQQINSFVGAIVVPTDAIKRDDFLIGNMDSEAVRFFLYENPQFLENGTGKTGELQISQYDQHGTFASEGKVLLLATIYPRMEVYRPKEFVYGQFSTAITELETP